MSSKVIALGELLVRFSPPGKNLIAYSQALDIEVGGAEANVLAGLAALGRDTAIVSRIADNPLGALAAAALRARGVDTRHVTALPGRMGLYFYEPGQGRRASSITYDRQGSVFVSADWSDLDLGAILADSGLLHMSGITPALGRASADHALRAAKAAKLAGVAVSFDCNFRSQLWEAWSADPVPILRELIDQADILFGNHRDVALVTGRPFSGEGSGRRRAAAEAAFDAFPNLRMIASTARHVVDSDRHIITARIDQTAGFAESEEVTVSGIVDRIGTGDAFAAGVLHEWLRGGDCQAMVRTGLALGVLKHGVPGDMSSFTEANVAAFWSDERDVRR